MVEIGYWTVDGRQRSSKLNSKECHGYHPGNKEDRNGDSSKHVADCRSRPGRKKGGRRRAPKEGEAGIDEERMDRSAAERVKPAPAGMEGRREGGKEDGGGWRVGE